MIPTAKILLLTPIALMFIASPVTQAVVNVPYPSGTPYYNTTDTITNSDSGWSSGWGTGNTNDGWAYVGQVGGANDASGVYLGNGWVITAGHVGALDFTLGTNTYATTGYSYTNFTFNYSGTLEYADLNLFRISTTSVEGNAFLPTNNLTIIPTYTSTAQTIVMIGYGDANVGRQKSWGINTVTTNNLLLSLDGYPYTSVDFGTSYGTNDYGTTNSAQLVIGDSGGGDYIKIGRNWYLAGLNEANDQSGASYLVNLGYYNAQITAVMASVPEPFSWCEAVMGLSVIGFALFRRWKVA